MTQIHTELAVDGEIFSPDTPGFAEEIQGYNLLVPHAPRLVVAARSAADVVAAVDHARTQGWSVGVMNTGHGPSRAADGVMITTRRMRGVSVDPEARTAVVEAGVRSSELVAAAAAHGLAPLNGSSPGVGVVGYTVGGGVPLLGRMHGYAADRVRRIELVTADGERRSLTRESGGELFWGVLGGKDNFGIVTELEMDLVPVDDINGGGLWWTGDDVAGAVRAYVEWTRTAPDHVASSVLVMRLPDIVFIPEAIRGKFIAHVRLLHLGEPSEAEELVAQLRAVPGIVQDTFGPMKYADVATIHNEPEGPVRFEARNTLLGDIDDAGVDALVDEVGPDSGYLLELRHLRGRLGERPRHGAVGRHDGHFTLYTGTALQDEDAASAATRQAVLHDRMTPWSVGGPCPSFLSGPSVTPEVLARGFARDDHDRLRRLKSQVDPHNLFRVNFNIEPADA